MLYLGNSHAGGGAFLGLRFLTWLSNVCVPLLIATIGYAVYQVGALSFEQSSDLQSFHVWDGKGISLVLASSIAATIDLPTFYRHARQRKESTGASIVNYLIAMPLVQIAGMWLYYGTKEKTITQAFAAHPSFSWKVWVVCFMLLAGWTTNNVNLYSAALSLKSLFSQLSFSKLMAIAGLGGCLLVFIPLLDQFAQSLDLIGIFVASMGLVMFMAYILESVSMHPNSLCVWLAWSIGIGSGLIAKFLPAWGTGAPVLDAAMAAGLALPLIHFFSSNGLFNCLKATTFKEEIR